MKFVSSLFTRGWILLLAVALFAVAFVDYKKMSEHAWPSTLSRLRPSYAVLVNVVDQKKPFEETIFEDFIHYLSEVNKIVGQRFDADILLAYSKYQLGYKSAAQTLFVSAMERNPSYFWSYYNLGLLSYRNGDMANATSLLERAAFMDPELSLKFILTSRIFLPLTSEGGYNTARFHENIRKARVDCFHLLAHVYLAAAQFDKVIVISQKALETAKQDETANFYYYWATALMKKGEWMQAGQVFEKCLTLMPDHPEALAGLGIVMQQINQPILSASYMGRAQAAHSERGTALPDFQKLQLRVF